MRIADDEPSACGSASERRSDEASERPEAAGCKT